MFTHLTLRQRLLLLPSLTLLGLAAVQFTNSYAAGVLRRQVVLPNLESVMMAGYENGLKSLVDCEAQTLGRLLRPQQTREEKIAAIVAETDPVRFFDDRSGYFFMTSPACASTFRLIKVAMEKT